jgi:hypothetical protein
MTQSDAERLRILAEQCRRQAATSTTHGAAELLYGMAKDYDLRAAALSPNEKPDPQQADN